MIAMNVLLTNAWSLCQELALTQSLVSVVMMMDAALKDGDEHIRWEAVKALGELGVSSLIKSYRSKSR